jgi:hypothetical protein
MDSAQQGGKGMRVIKGSRVKVAWEATGDAPAVGEIVQTSASSHLEAVSQDASTITVKLGGCILELMRDSERISEVPEIYCDESGCYVTVEPCQIIRHERFCESCEHSEKVHNENGCSRCSCRSTDVLK